jgi:pyruvate dehydrogenase E2 component (dihydrolipoamide acetyltransferase)
VPLRGARALAAEKYVRSRREIPDATCWLDVDATGLVEARDGLAGARNGLAGARDGLAGAGGPRVGLLALLARICVAALRRHPMLNATVDGGDVVRRPSVHLGLAAAGARGLTVPVVRDAHRMDLAALAGEVDRLTTAAREGTLAPADLTGGTFTLNNYGVLGVDGATPILNYPEAAMLGVGRIVDRPWVHEGVLVARPVMLLSLTFDHRVCDGAEAAGFLRHVAERVERPVRLLYDT